MSNTMWGGRFAERPGRNHGGDQRLDRLRPQARRPGHCRLEGPCRHARRHRASSKPPTPRPSPKGLAQVKGEIEAGTFSFSRALEDIHMNVESRLAEIVGPAAGRLHTARSRNDQVAADFRLWVRDAIDALDRPDRRSCNGRSPTARSTAADMVMPGFTHLQSAQPVTFGHHLLAYVEMLGARRAGGSRTRASASTNVRSAPPRWPAPRFRSTAR